VDYSTAAQVFEAVDALEADVSKRLRALSEALASARPFATSLLRDQERHRETRARLRRRLGIAASPPPRAEVGSPLSLADLRSAQDALVNAHAEGLSALGDEIAVDALARNMVDLSRHLTVIDLWIEAEETRG
jgi:hypothetical protein